MPLKLIKKSKHKIKLICIIYLEKNIVQINNHQDFKFFRQDFVFINFKTHLCI